LIRADGFEQFTLGDSASLTVAAVEIYQFARQPTAGALADQRMLSESMARRLGLADIAADPEVQRILVVLDGALHYLPVATLQVPLNGNASRTVPILERFLVTRLPTSDLLARREVTDTESGKRLQTFALLADPVLGLDDPRLPSANNGLTLAMNDSPRRDSDPDRLTRLPGTEREAQALRQTLKDYDIQVRTGFQVNREWVVSGQLDDYDVIHFATHGIFDDSGSGYSGLALSRYTPGGEELTWLLGAQDIQRMQLHAELVTLSGCETALGREIRGEGLVGITRAFLNAGARQVVASLWPISDRASARLMELFYSKLVEGASTPAEALQAAQRELRGNPRYRDPYYWAGFVIQGI
jgi:CHAT domain-containing protein